MHMTARRCGFAIGLMLLCGVAEAQTVDTATPAAAAQATPPPDKSGDTLFDPVPDSQLRQLETDRPGKSFSPFTVDAGHLQIESDAWLYSWDHWSPDGTTSRSTTILDPNVKLGLNDWAELDAVLPLFDSEVTRSRVGSGRESGQGVGDLQLGGKINFAGNDGDGSRGIGTIFYAELPSGASGLRQQVVQYTIALPIVLPLPDKFSITIEPGLGLLDNAGKRGLHGDYQFIVNVNRQIPGTPVTAAIELALDAEGDHNIGDQNTIDGSLQWPIGNNVQLDSGVYIGLNRSAPDWSPYVGFAVRF